MNYWRNRRETIRSLPGFAEEYVESKLKFIDKLEALGLTEEQYDEQQRAERNQKASEQEDLRTGVREPKSAIFEAGKLIPDSILTYIGPTENRFGRPTLRRMRCKCACGNGLVIPYADLYKGKYSCGCAVRNRKLKHNFEGESIGRLEIGKYTVGVGWDCYCRECGEQEIVRFSHLLKAAGERLCTSPNRPKDKTEKVYAVELCARFSGIKQSMIITGVMAKSPGEAIERLKAGIKYEMIR